MKQKPAAVKQFNVRLTEEVYDAVASEARKFRRSMTAQINLDLERQHGLYAEEGDQAA